MLSPRRLWISLVLLALVLTACEPVGGLRQRRPGFADHGDQEAAVTATTIDDEWRREEGWAVAPALETPEGATRVSALLTLLSPDAPLPDLSARGLVSGEPATDWLGLTLYFEDGEARVATADFGLRVESIEVRVLESELESLVELRFSGSDPALVIEQEGATGTTSAGLARAELRAELTGLGIVTREEWGASRGTCSSRDGARRRISIHHTETGSVDPARQLRSIQSYHRSKGWCDVGYHFLVGADGRIYEGRPVELLGAHVRDNNSGNLGISFIGCFDARDCATPTTITDAMIENAGRLVGTLADLYGITVSSSTVRGHRDQVSTSCPGDALYARLGDIVSIGQTSRLGGDAPPPVTPPAPEPPASGAVCRHSLGGTYAASACSEGYQCCEGTWRSRSPGCGACTCVETTGRTGCTGTSTPPSEPAPSDPPASLLLLPPTGVGLDYQLGGAYAPPAGTGIVSRDRTAAPASGLYNICYVNGFQTQPGEESFWLDDHPELILRDAAGAPVIDGEWNEMLLDVGTSAKRAALAEIVGGWIRGCASAGFDAVEIDNLDSYTRSGGRLSSSHAVAFMRLLSDVAHGEGLAIAQKNSSELVGERAAMGTDFAVSEECNRYGECETYTSAYGDHVLVVEYRREDFDAGCRAFPALPTVLRDLPLSTPGSGGYVHDECHGGAAPADPAPADPSSGPPAGASCTHSFGGAYANTACSASYQCCDGSWRTRGSCGSCYCVEESGTSGCGGSSAPPPAPAPGEGGLPYAGLTLSGSEVPRAGLANATLRSALGLATEPYGTLSTFEGASYVRGRVSWFGGPRDTGVTSTETGAITGEHLRSLNDPVDPSASTLSSRPADYYYVAMRWAYAPNGTRWWRDARLVIVNPASGRAVVVRPVDWGPNTSTRRILDLSPQALTDLGLSTDGEALVAFAPAGTPLGPVR
jgi:hypothetical protein